MTAGSQTRAIPRGEERGAMIAGQTDVFAIEAEFLEVSGNWNQVSELLLPPGFCDATLQSYCAWVEGLRGGGN